MTQESPMQTEIKPCPNPECKIPVKLRVFRDTKADADGTVPGGNRYQVIHDYCGYRGPLDDTEAGAIRLHNLLCRSSSPAGQVEGMALQNPGTCYVCGAPAFCSVNVAPGAASGGEMKPVCDKHNPYSAPVAPMVSAWRPIESAPKDEGSEMLVTGGGFGSEETGHEFYSEGFDDVAHVRIWEGSFRRAGDYNDYFKPTLWMPLPLLPSQETEK